MSLRLRPLQWPRPLARVVLLAAILAAGLWARSASGTGLASSLAGWSPWVKQTTVTLYFADASGKFLVPVSRRMPTREDLPRAVAQALLDGPVESSGLTNPIPPGAEVRSFLLADGLAHVNLSAAFLSGEPETAQAAVVETLTALPGVDSVALSVEGEPLGGPATRTPMLYFASANELVAVPTEAANPRAALAAYLAGPPGPELLGLPPDVQLRAYEYDPANGLLSLNFTYTPSVRALALNDPEGMRRVLLGLIASLTEFSEVQAVRLDFEGQARLGLGQCSDLLRAPQLRPEILNDERLLGR